MKAAVLKEPGELILEDREKPDCPDNGILIKIEVCGICSADVKMIFNGHRALSYPCIPGHEITGMVVESQVPEFKGGECVQIAPGIICNECRYCKSGMSNQCPEIKIIGFNSDGGYAEYLPISAKGVKSGIINKIHENLSFAEASLAEPLASCINGQQQAGVFKGDTVLIFGAGPIGCLHAMLARTNGAEKVLLCDILSSRLKNAVPTEADRLINLKDKSIEKIVEKETDGKGVDVVFLAAKEAANQYPLFEIIAPRGRINFFSGLAKDNSILEIDANLIHYKELTITGSYGSTAEQNKKALQLMADGEIDVNWLITNRLSLEEVNKGIDIVKQCKGFKSIIDFTGGDKNE